MEAEPPPLEERRRLQEELSEFVESCCRTLEEVTASLGWSLDQLDPGDQAEAEVIRDVIKVHMEELSNHWQEEQERAEDGAEKYVIVFTDEAFA
ncbi:U11/U12 small nuclear ribonucleoprotein 48 kDa protein [Cricetulus griseus]|uniref:U11/U12 small nuclear ribonucleoprotein 48 kDa protein n=1 Tax=Cricetulus griseus TaxID=10029 RepID=G3HD95_CRIGR|nr:U11/U12 small nuclear ribonucleoprotein 48 kDa protein [Cricetulus griseus]